MLTGLVSNFGQILNFNEATLSGCSDIIVIRHENENSNHYNTESILSSPVDTSNQNKILKSTSFHARFGRNKILFPDDKFKVDIYVNDSKADFNMYLSLSGEAYFLHNTESEQITSNNFPVKLKDKNQDGRETIQTSKSFQKSINTNINNSMKLANNIQNENNNHDITSLAYKEFIHHHMQNNDSPSLFLYKKYRFSRISFSYCGHLLISGNDCDVYNDNLFRENILKYKDVVNNSLIFDDPSLMTQFDNESPLFPASVVFSDEILKKYFPKNDSISIHGPDDTAFMYLDFLKYRCGEQQGSNYFKSYKPTSKQLESLNLDYGANKIVFVVQSSSNSICKYLEGKIYFWNQDDKIIISDVDGTITVSDIRGHILPILGKPCCHKGVAKLFEGIKNNNYNFLYLTARAIGQADCTRNLLFSLKQENNNYLSKDLLELSVINENNKSTINDNCHLNPDEFFKLPDGPLIMSPDRLLQSFKREVIERKPFDFKISVLQGIRSIFPENVNPYFAGFGNRDSDFNAYLGGGVLKENIFIIDTHGTVTQRNPMHDSLTTYSVMANHVDKLFPRITAHIPREYAEESGEIFRKTNPPEHTFKIEGSEINTPNDFFSCLSLEFCTDKNIPIIN